MFCFVKSICRVAANRHAILLTALRTHIATINITDNNIVKNNHQQHHHYNKNSAHYEGDHVDNEQTGSKKESVKPLTQQLYKSTHRGSGVIKSWHAPHSAAQQKNNNNNYTNVSTHDASDNKYKNIVTNHSQEKLQPNVMVEDKTISPSASDEQTLYSTRSSCAEDVGPVPERPLTPLQRRQLQMQNKAAFVLSPQALRRVKYLLSQYKPTQNIEHNTSSQTNKTGNNNKATNTVNKEAICSTEESANHSTNSKANKEENKEGNMEASQETFVKPNGIRIGVRRRGCSGYSYTVNYHFPSTSSGSKESSTFAGGALQKSTRPSALSDVIVEQDGVQVVVAADALFYVIGTQMDYVVRDVEEKFVFANPNQKYSCGCEESFMPYDDDDDRDD